MAGDWCLVCQKEVHAVVGLNGAAQVAKQCGACGAPIGDALSKPLAGFDATTEKVRPIAPAPDRSAAAPVLRLAQPPAKQGPAVTEATGPADILSMVRARLVWLDSECARLSGLETEAKKLRKMLAAADRVAPADTP